jgi:4,5-DOPA dioxygenase extradiol
MTLTPVSTRMPVVFIGHGNPMLTLTDNRFTRAWQHIGDSLPRPKAIVVVSAHWYRDGVAVTAMDAPRTIHDFSGFPQELFDVRYAAPGAPALAQRVCDLLAPLQVELDYSWGLDHGTWAVLKHVYPRADVPIVQLSIDASQPAQFHYDLGKRLAPLRNEGILIVGSGNVVHNLRMARWEEDAAPYDWAQRFELVIKDHMGRGDHAPLIDFHRLDPQAALSVPSPDHYLPLLYVAGAQTKGDAVAFPVEGIDMGSMSMLTAVIGAGI